MSPIEGRSYEDDSEMRTFRAGQSLRRETPGPTNGHGDGSSSARGSLERRHAGETKPFFLTSEFVAPVLLIIAMAISAATNDGFDAPLFWILTSAVVAAYVISRGIAKSAARSRAIDERRRD
jgi:hypothetical protein